MNILTQALYHSFISDKVTKESKYSRLFSSDIYEKHKENFRCVQITYECTTIILKYKIGILEYSFLQNRGIVALGPVSRPYIQMQIQNHCSPLIIWYLPQHKNVC